MLHVVRVVGHHKLPQFVSKLLVSGGDLPASLPHSLHVGVDGLKGLLTHVAQAMILLLLLSIHQPQVLLHMEHDDVDLRCNREGLGLHLVELHVGRGETLKCGLVSRVQLLAKQPLKRFPEA